MGMCTYVPNSIRKKARWTITVQGKGKAKEYDMGDINAEKYEKYYKLFLSGEEIELTINF